jgi:hypothetical protein
LSNVIVYGNCQGLTTNYDYFEQLCADKTPSILCLSETHLTSDILEEMNIKEYQLLRCDSNSRHTGGVAMYVEVDLKFNVVFNCCRGKTWILAINVIGNWNAVVAVVYKSPKEKIFSFLDALEEFFDAVVSYSRPLILVGDVNLNLLRKSKNVSRYMHLLDVYNLKQFVNEPTRSCNSSATLIDHVISNLENLAVVVDKCSPSDHYLLEISYGTRNLDSQLRRIKIKSWKNYSKEAANNIVDRCDWNWLGCAECDAINIYNNLKHVVGCLVKEVTVRERKFVFTPALYELKSNVKLAYEKYNLTNEEDDELLAREAVRNYKKELKAVKCKAVKDSLISNRDNPKRLWNILKNQYDAKDVKVTSLMINGVLVDDNIEIANELNSYFIESIGNIVANIAQPKFMHYNNRIVGCQEQMFFRPVTMREVKVLLFALKSKSYVDGIKGRVLCDLVGNTNFMTSITHLVNDCLEQGVMPLVFKSSTITPIPKVKYLVSPESFRPINNLPVLEKLIEQVVFNQLNEHVENNKLLSDAQFGFRRNHSTEAAILDVVSEIIDAHEIGNCMILLSLDFRRAFETVLRVGLCRKLRIYGLHDSVLAWFENYLNNRKQVTNFNGNFSNERDAEFGLPQGSKLSCLLFILFINDLHLQLNGAKVTVYADDAVILIQAKELKVALDVANKNLEIIKDWLRFNCMEMNVAKCNAMIFNAVVVASDDKLLFDGVEIKQVRALRYLGVYLDDQLSLSCHCEFLMGKLNQKLALLRRLSPKLDDLSRRMFFNSLIMPHIDYCSSYLLLLDETKFQRLQKVINKAMRVVLRVDNFIGADELCADLGVLKVRERVELNCLKLFNKLLTRGEPLRLFTRCLRNCDVRQRSLRDDSKFRLPLWKSSVSRRSFFYHTVDVYNRINFDNELSFIENCVNYIKS